MMQTANTKIRKKSRVMSLVLSLAVTASCFAGMTSLANAEEVYEFTGFTFPTSSTDPVVVGDVTTTSDIFAGDATAYFSSVKVRFVDPDTPLWERILGSFERTSINDIEGSMDVDPAGITYGNYEGYTVDFFWRCNNADDYAGKTIMIDGKTVPLKKRSATQVSANFEMGSLSSEVVVSSVTIKAEGDQQTVKVGETLQMTAEILPENATNQTLGWDVFVEGMGDQYTGKATIDENGLLTGVKAGVVEVFANAQDSEGNYGLLRITVVDDAPPVSSEPAVSETPDSSSEVPVVSTTPPASQGGGGVSSPKTGDLAGSAVFFGVLAVAVCGAIVLGRRKAGK